MEKYEFDFELFKKFRGKICPCLLVTRENAHIDNICPCKEFIEKGVCRCGLFNKKPKTLD